MLSCYASPTLQNDPYTATVQQYVDLGNFSTTRDDLVYMQVDMIEDLIATQENKNGGIDPNTYIHNYVETIGMYIDLPQMHSYDTADRTGSYLVAMLHRYGPNKQDTVFNVIRSGIERNDGVNDVAQSWRFEQKPAPIAFRAEVFQQKTWTVRFAFLNSGVDVGKMYSRVYLPTVVFNVYK